MLLSFDVTADAIPEHDHWHTYEHLRERLSIPGFLRGTRWIAVDGQPRYMVLYEVQSLATLNSTAYLDRLNAPTPWTARMMAHYRGMSRSLCSVVGSTGFGLGRRALLVQFKAMKGLGADAQMWLRESFLPDLPAHQGLSSAHFLQAAALPTMTKEQQIRGADSAVNSALIVTGHDEAALTWARQVILGRSDLGQRGENEISMGVYALHHALAHTEIEA